MLSLFAPFRNITFTLALCFASSACADQQAPPPVAVAQSTIANAPSGLPALWKIADEDTTIYVFGTVHALPKDVDWYQGNIATALDSSDTLVTEIDMTPEAMAVMPALVMGKGMLPKGTTLRSLLLPEQLGKYEEGIAKLGISAASLDPLEPWLAGLQVTQAGMQSAGFNPDSGVEAVLEKAMKEGSSRDALETLDFQFSVFDELPMESQIAFLMQAADDPQAGVAMLNQMVAEWAEGDVETLGKLMTESLEADPILADRLLYSRNANWAEWIAKRLDLPGTIFMAVGAGHLAGDKSVQAMLEMRGIETVRVQ